VPVQDAADERGDEGDASLRASHGLDDGEQEGQVAGDALLLEDLPGPNAFVGRRNLYIL
jgi:hypothetical protein